MVEENERRSVDPGLKLKLSKPVIKEYEVAISAIGGQPIEGSKEQPKTLCVIDTATRLAAVLYEKALYHTKIAQESLAEVRKKNIHHIADVVSGNPAISIIKISPIQLDTFMDSLAVILSKGRINGRLTPSGLIALSALARSPSEEQAKERTRREAIKLLADDSVASYLYLTNPGTGFFNGQFVNSSLPSVIDAVVVSPSPVK